MPPIVNPYAKVRPSHNIAMGRQSQQRISNTKRAFRLAENSHKTKKSSTGGQRTLLGKLAFVSERDCEVCKAHRLRKLFQSARIPKRAHHVLCIKNRKTKGFGPVTVQSEAMQAEEKRLQALFNKPLEAHEKGSFRHLTKEAGERFFAPRQFSKNPMSSFAQQSKSNTIMDTSRVTGIDLCRAVSGIVSDQAFQDKHKNKGAPLAMVALFATVVVDKIIRSSNKGTSLVDYFDGLTMVVPACPQDDNPHYHSIVGQKLLLVDWAATHGLEVECPGRHCCAKLINDRTNFSKNKTLYPIFGLDGPPSWCIVMSMVCKQCHSRFNANDGEVLLNVPAYARATYPVETKFAQSNKAAHLNVNATDVFSSIMVTYANGELCSRLLYDCINRAYYIERLKVYYSYAIANNKERVRDYVEKDGEFIKTFPPLGDTIRDVFDDALTSENNPWGISDHNRNTREIQGVTSYNGIFTQDHTFEGVKNYQRRLGAKAVWDVAVKQYWRDCHIRLCANNKDKRLCTRCRDAC